MAVEQLSQFPIDKLQGLLERLITISMDAGGKIMEIYISDFSIRHKEDRSPVTTADLAAHEIICTALAKLTPDIPILSEESAATAYTHRRTWPCYWLIDPLDGTREFIKRNGEFTVNIALIENHRPILGAVYTPVEETCYYAIQGHGAYRQTADGVVGKIHTKKTCLEDMIIASSHHTNQRQKSFSDQFPDAQIVKKGSSLKVCLIAAGKFDIYPRFGPTSEWDTAAAQCIIENAGGCLVNMQLEDLRYNTQDSLINPYFLAIADMNFPWKNYLKVCL